MNVKVNFKSEAQTFRSNKVCKKKRKYKKKFIQSKMK